MRKININLCRLTNFEPTVRLVKDLGEKLQTLDNCRKRFESFQYGKGPSDHLYNQLVKYSLQNYVTTEKFPEGVSLKHRSCIADDKGIGSVFTGDRLILTSKHNTSKILKSPYLLEFYS